MQVVQVVLAKQATLVRVLVLYFLPSLPLVVAEQEFTIMQLVVMVVQEQVDKDLLVFQVILQQLHHLKEITVVMVTLLHRLGVQAEVVVPVQ